MAVKVFFHYCHWFPFHFWHFPRPLPRLGYFLAWVDGFHHFLSWNWTKNQWKRNILYKSRKKSSKWRKICTLQLEFKQSFTNFSKIWTLPYSLGRYIFGMVCRWFSLLFSLDFGITLGFFLGPSDDFCRCCFRFCVCIEWISTLKRPVVSPMRGRGFADHAEC